LIVRNAGLVLVINLGENVERGTLRADEEKIIR
jgi:hypothetical protein